MKIQINLSSKIVRAIIIFPVLENQTVPQDILMVKATDADHGENGVVEYYLLTEGPEFAIDRVSGQLSLQQPLDRDNGQKEHFLTVIAKDLADDPLQGSCSFTVVVEDINDNPPIFDQESYSRTIPSDTQENAPILRLTATDNDAGKNAEVRYSIDGSGDDLEYFLIDENSGVLSLKKSLAQSMVNEREFHLTARASDVGEIGQLPLSSSTQVVLSVGSPGTMPPSVDKQMPETATVSEDATLNTDIVSICARSNSASNDVYMDMINGNVPETNSEGTFDISENVDADSLLRVCQAVDKDTSTRIDQLTYSFKDPPPHVRDNFRIDPSTGEIWNIEKLDRETEKQYRIPVQVTDGKNVRDRQYWIIVNDQNDEPPKFNLETGVYETEVEEDLTIGKDTGIRLVVEDQDILNEFSYQIISGNEASKFHINSETGVISVNKELDYDAPVNDRISLWKSELSRGAKIDNRCQFPSLMNEVSFRNSVNVLE
ncbi:Cadherin EGF LAG seven-pass G-type receptor 3 [Armadillidium vulgare]|nr:Cadherin EGF LAG seven-pass G-type receptor 3 [Armadillidium vulgare]